MRTVKRGDRYDGELGEVVTLVLPKGNHIAAILVNPGDFDTTCLRCPLFWVPDGCKTYLSDRICCISLEEAVE